MSYEYEAYRSRLFTEEGQRIFLAFRDEAYRLLEIAGAVKHGKIHVRGSGCDSFMLHACADRMVELGELKEHTDDTVRGQDRVFTAIAKP